MARAASIWQSSRRGWVCAMSSALGPCLRVGLVENFPPTAGILGGSPDRLAGEEQRTVPGSRACGRFGQPPSRLMDRRRRRVPQYPASAVFLGPRASALDADANTSIGGHGQSVEPLQLATALRPFDRRRHQYAPSPPRPLRFCERCESKVMRPSRWYRRRFASHAAGFRFPSVLIAAA